MTDHAWDPRTVPVQFIKDTATAVSVLNGTLREATDVAVDTETVVKRDADGNMIKGIDLDLDGPGTWRVTSIAAKFATPDGPRYEAWVLDMREISAPALQRVFQGVTPWGWNANFDRGVLKRDGLHVRYWNDAMLFDAVLKQGAYYATGMSAWYTSLDDAGRRWLDHHGIEGKADTRYSYDEDTPLTAEQIQYAADDAIITLFTAEVLVAEAEKVGLLEACYRATNAQPFIHSMKLNGLPFDTTTYQAVIDRATAMQDAAAERVAVLTTGRELLSTLERWAGQTGHLSTEILDASHQAAAENGTDQSLETGLHLLHDPEVFGRFIAAMREAADGAVASIATTLGIEPTEELFSEESDTYYQLPFAIEDAGAIRRWIKKVAPQFVTEYVEATGSRSKGLTAANDMVDVYEKMKEQPADVSQEVAQVAVYLRARLRYSAILEQYEGATGPATLRPDWNLGSGPQVKEYLNRFAEDAVKTYFKQADGVYRLLQTADSVDNKVLKLIGGPLCKAILDYREHNKMVTTYGDELVGHVRAETGRIHASYSQELTGTARLASFKPNAQNLSPEAKPHICLVRKSPDGSLVTRDPEGRMRVFVAADLSQAELRFIAHMAQDENMLAAFRSGEDLHERTASLMFSVDLKSLKVYGNLPLREIGTDVKGLEKYIASSPDMPGKDLYKQLRSKAKAVSFGYAYGLKGASLAQQLTVQGVLTTKEEADELLAQFDIAYPQVAAWMAVRVKFIDDISAGLKDMSVPSGVDFENSWRLHRLYYRVNSAHKALTTKLDRKATPREVAERMLSDQDLTARQVAAGHDPENTIEWAAAWENVREQQSAQIAWALGHYGSAMLSEDGTPWSFESRNSVNRRRLFQIGTEAWTKSMVALVARSRRKYARDLTAAWVAQYNAEIKARHDELVEAGSRPGAPKYIQLTKKDPRTQREVTLTAKELEKALPEKEQRIAFVQFILQAYESLSDPAAAREMLFRSAMADCVRALGNQYRNHPIQSGVADAVLVAYHRIDVELGERFPNAQGIQSVHDSIVIECDLADAKAVREIVVRHMEAALSEMCPTVPCVADGDVQLSLADKSIVSDEELDELVTRYALAA